MARVYLSIGSNIDPAQHVGACLDGLQSQFGDLSVSPIYTGAAVGFEGSAFWNLAVGLDTALAPADLDRALKQLENDLGRRRDGPRFSDRTIDIDLLLYGDRTGDVDGIELPRPEILEQAFVLRPLSDLIPEYRHPLAGRSLAELWQAMAQQGHDLQPVTLPTGQAPRSPEGGA